MEKTNRIRAASRDKDIQRKRTLSGRQLGQTPATGRTPKNWAITRTEQYPNYHQYPILDSLTWADGVLKRVSGAFLTRLLHGLTVG